MRLPKSALLLTMSRLDFFALSTTRSTTLTYGFTIRFGSLAKQRSNFSKKFAGSAVTRIFKIFFMARRIGVLSECASFTYFHIWLGTCIQGCVTGSLHSQLPWRHQALDRYPFAAGSSLMLDWTNLSPSLFLVVYQVHGFGVDSPSPTRIDYSFVFWKASPIVRCVADPCRSLPPQQKHVENEFLLCTS